MAQASKSTREKAVETLGEALRKFVSAVGETFNDPAVAQKGKDFANSVVDAAANVVQSKVTDADARAKFRAVGSAAEKLGSSVKQHFES